MVAHSLTQLPIELLQKIHLSYGKAMFQICCTYDITILSTNAGRTDGRTSTRESHFIFCPMLCAIALDRHLFRLYAATAYLWLRPFNPCHM